MSVTSTPPAPAPRTATSLWQRHRSSLVIAAVLVAAVFVVVVLGTGATTSDPLDPDNPGPAGSRALARVLADNGVEVDVARSAAALAELDVADRSTILVSDPDLLGEDALGDLRRTYPGRRIVVAGAGPGATQSLGSALAPGRVRLGGRARGADCDDPVLADLLDGLEVLVDDALAYPTDGCFHTRDGVLVTETDGVTLLGADQVLTNDQVLRADNAALALRLLGQDPQLVWYVPSLSDLDGADGVSLRSLLPPWIQPGLGIAILVAAGVVLWRGRRLGPLATEPVPVVVKAVETTHSLGRLYRRSGDRAHAAATLRRAALRRAGSRLQLGRRTGPDEVVRAVARHLGRRDDEVAALLSPTAPAPTTDPGLITLARDLAELDREVRRR